MESNNVKKRKMMTMMMMMGHLTWLTHHYYRYHHNYHHYYYYYYYNTERRRRGEGKERRSKTDRLSIQRQRLRWLRRLNDYDDYLALLVVLAYSCLSSNQGSVLHNYYYYHHHHHRQSEHRQHTEPEKQSQHPFSIKLSISVVFMIVPIRREMWVEFSHFQQL